MGRVAMTVLRLRKAAEEPGAGEPTMWRAIEPGGMSTELSEDGGAPNASLRQLPAPGTVAVSDLAARLAGADAAISTIQELLGEVRTSHDELRSDLGRPQAGSRRVARAGRAAYRKAVVAAPRRLKSDVVDRPVAMRRK